MYWTTSTVTSCPLLRACCAPTPWALRDSSCHPQVLHFAETARRPRVYPTTISLIELRWLDGLLGHHDPTREGNRGSGTEPKRSSRPKLTLLSLGCHRPPPRSSGPPRATAPQEYHSGSSSTAMCLVTLIVPSRRSLLISPAIISSAAMRSRRGTFPAT